MKDMLQAAMLKNSNKRLISECFKFLLVLHCNIDESHILPPFSFIRRISQFSMFSDL
jgi:hypothetical protein